MSRFLLCVTLSLLIVASNAQTVSRVREYSSSSSSQSRIPVTTGTVVSRTSEFSTSARQPVAVAGTVTRTAASQFSCPAGFELRGTQCFNIECATPIVPTTARPIQIIEQRPNYCVVDAIRLETAPAPQVQCPANSYMDSTGRCIAIDVKIVCPQGTRQEGNVCMYYVQGVTDVTVETRCPAGTSKFGNTCVYTAEAPTLRVECPSNTEKRGDICYMKATEVRFRCADGSMPVDGICTIQPQGTVTVQCPPGSIRMSDNECQVTPPQVVNICPDGSAPINNICYVKVQSVTPPTVEFECPDGSFKNIFGTCVAYAEASSPPRIDIKCPYGAEKDGNTCYMRVTSEKQPDFKYVCPRNSYQRDGNTCVFDIPEIQIESEIYCPPEMQKIGNKCVHYVKRDQCVETIKETAMDCGSDIESSGHSAPSIVHNNNTVHAPTNITSTNINNINITSDDCGNGQKERIIVHNGKTERIPCPKQAMPVVQESCCNVQSPRICTQNQNQWKCGHTQYRRCGGFCRSGRSVQLKPRHSMYSSGRYVIAPMAYHAPMHASAQMNCSGCVSGDYETCTPDCYTYPCDDGSCDMMDQEEFCSSHGEGGGCYSFDGYDMI